MCGFTSKPQLCSRPYCSHCFIISPRFFFFILFSFLSCNGLFFPPFIFVTSQQSARVKGNVIVLTFLRPQINMFNRFNHTSRWAQSRGFSHHTPHWRPTGFSLTAVCGRVRGSVSLRLEIADMSDVSSHLGVRMLWAERVAEAYTRPKWANPFHVSPRPDSKEAQSFPRMRWRCNA